MPHVRFIQVPWWALQTGCLLSRVFKEWRWTEVNKETYEGYKTHFDYAHFARDKQTTTVREYVDMSTPDLECVIFDRRSFPEPVAFRSDAFVLQVEGTAPILVGQVGLWVYSGQWKLSFEAIAGRISE